jgi:hypothetical protein
LEKYRQFIDLKCHHVLFWDRLATNFPSFEYPLKLTEIGPSAHTARREWLLQILKQVSSNPSLWINWTSCDFFSEIDRASIKNPDVRIEFWKMLQPECLRNLPGSSVSLLLDGMNKRGAPDPLISLMWALLKSPNSALAGTNIQILKDAELFVDSITDKFEQLFWTLRVTQLKVHLHTWSLEALESVVNKISLIILNIDNVSFLCPFALHSLSNAIFNVENLTVSKLWLETLRNFTASGLLRKTIFYTAPFKATEVRPLAERLVWVRSGIRDGQIHDAHLSDMQILKLLNRTGVIEKGIWTPMKNVPVSGLTSICMQIMLYYRSDLRFPILWAWDESFLSVFDPKHPLQCFHNQYFINAGLTMLEIYNELFNRDSC